MMRTVLRERGFDDANIETLADGVDGAALPTRSAILSSLQKLAQRSRRGDIVYLHFSGHGSRQPAGDVEAGADGSSRSSRWRPVFLPRDVRGWDGKGNGHIPNAITDTVMRDAVDRINATGAFVFAVFDACHSARLVRGAPPHADGPPVRLRQVDPAALGVPKAASASDEVRLSWHEEAPRNPSAAPSTARGRAVYFYAAQSAEMTSHFVLPTGGNRTAWQGLFTWHVAQALASGQSVSYRQLGQHVLSRYDRLPATQAEPLFGGDGLDDTVFDQTTTLVRQWPLEQQQKQQQGRASMAGGALAGVSEAALVALLSDPLAPATADTTRPAPGTIGYAQVKTLDAERAWLEPVEWQGFAPPSMSLLPKGTWARLVSNPVSFALRVAVDQGPCAPPCTAARVPAALRRDGVPGVDVRWVDGDVVADVRLRIDDRSVQVIPAGSSDTARSRWGYAAPPADDAAALEQVTQQTAAALHRVARVRNLLTLASRVALRPPDAAGVRVDVKVQARGAARPVAVTPDRLADIRPGDLVTLQGRNTADDPRDLAAFWLGADQSISRVYPFDRRDAPRLAAGDATRLAGLKVDEGSEGTERLLVVSVPMRRGREAADFAFLEQSPLARLRNTTDHAELQALLYACLADYRTRSSDGAPAPVAQQLSMQVYTFRISAP